MSDQLPKKPVYPHSAWIDELVVASDERLLTKAEITAITESQIFESLIQNTIPELRAMVAEMPEGVAHKNAQLYVTVACEFAQGMARDIASMMEARSVVRSALSLVKAP